MTVCVAGVHPALHSGLDGALDVAPWEGPGQLLHPLPDRAGGPAGHRPPGPQLPLPVGHRGPGQRRGRLRWDFLSEGGPLRPRPRSLHL